MGVEKPSTGMLTRTPTWIPGRFPPPFLKSVGAQRASEDPPTENPYAAVPVGPHTSRNGDAPPGHRLNVEAAPVRVMK